MKRILFALITLIASGTHNVQAQLVGSSCFLQGRYLEAGMQNNSSLGSGGSGSTIPSTYHPHGSYSPCSIRSMASVYDWGLDGWSTGTPAYMGDYTLPGSPWEGWGIEANGARGYGYSTTCGFTGTLSGRFTSFSSSGGRAIGMWEGNFLTGAAMDIRKEYRIDTNSSALVVTVVLVNTTGSTINDVYYIRTCDPDNSQSWGGSFTTINTIPYQHLLSADPYKRVMVTATAQPATASISGSPPAPYSLGTKDCRAKAIVYTSWPLSTSVPISTIFAGSGTGFSGLGTAYYNTSTRVTSDIAIGLVYNLGDILAGDSVAFSYAYIYNGTSGIDSAFPEPQLAVNGTVVADSGDTAAGCPVNVDVLYGDDKNWLWSTWTWSPSTGLATTTGVRNVINPGVLSAPVVYTITGVFDSSSGACASKTFYVTVLPGYTKAPGTRDTSYCFGFAAPDLSWLVVPDTGRPIIKYYTSATGGTGTTIPIVPSTATVGVDTYYVTQTIGLCESARIPIVVTITPPPAVTLRNNGPICAGEVLTILLFDTSRARVATFSWTGPGSFGSTSRDISFVSSNTDSGDYTVVATFDGCQTFPTTTTVVVKSAPPAPTVVNPTYCQFLPSVPLSATGSPLLWYTSATGGTGSTVAPTPSTTTPGIFRYYVTQSGNGCESPRAEIIVTILPEPAPPVITRQTYCQYDVAVPAAATGTSLLWYGMGLTGSSTAPTPTTDVPMTFTYYVTQTVLGCVSDSAIDTIIVKPQPAPPRPVDTSLCQFSERTALLASGTYLAWYPTPTGGVRVDSTPVPSTNVVGTTTYYVSQTVNGCTSLRAPLTVTILPRPTFDIAVAQKWVCQFDTLVLSYSGVALFDSTYRWTLPNGARVVSGSTADSMVSIVFDSLTFQNVTLTVKNFARCSFSDTFTARVIREPEAGFYVKENICAGDTVMLALRTRSTNAAEFTWGFDGADVVTASSSSGGPYQIRWLTSGLKVVSMRPRTEEGCLGDWASDTVRVRAVPDARIFNPGGVSGVICLEDSLMLKAVTEVDGYRYWWTPERFFNQNNRAKIWGQILISGYVSLHVSDGFGCSAADSVLISPDACCTVTFPTAFTPNNDGRNDFFRPIFKGYHRFQSFRIVNRWGQTVFESVNSESEWDGTFGGVPQDMGVYYYFIKFDCGDSRDKVEKGEVTLIR